MMRYQRVSPDCLPLSNGKKPNLRHSTTTSSKEDNSSSNGENGRTITNGGFNSTSFDGGAKGFRFRSPSRAKDLNNNNLTHSGGSGAPTSPTPHSENNQHENPKNQSQRLDASSSLSPSRGDVLLQWGQKKRSRVSRAEIRSVTVTDDSSSSSGQGKQPINTTKNKLQRRDLNGTMPPPPPPTLPSTATSHRNSISSRASHHRNSLVTSKETSGFISSRNLEERSAVVNGSPSRNSGSSSRGVSRSAVGKRSPPPDKVDRKISCSGSAKDEKQNGSIAQADRMDHSDSAPVQSEQEAGATNTALVAGAGEKVNVEVWPRIYIALSRKEKEDDFLVMKGTKLPHRPKKRAKNIDKALQYCFPGMWLSDLTKSRYEVREKKCAKKQKRRGLKGMESMDSDSE